MRTQSPRGAAPLARCVLALSCSADAAPAPRPAPQAVQLINHDGEVNRARYMPQNPFMLATKTVR